jgi:hypothetical protein
MNIPPIPLSASLTTSRADCGPSIGSGVKRDRKLQTVLEEFFHDG